MDWHKINVSVTPNPPNTDLSMPDLHLFIHYRKSHPGNGGSVLHELNQPIPVEFDQVMARFNQLPGGYCEPDGAWGWNTPDQQTRTGGTMQALGEQVMCVETWGQIAPRDWLPLLELFSLTPQTAIVQLVEEGRFLSADEFARELEKR